MQTKTVCVSAFFLLTICFVTSALRSSGDVVTCVFPYISNISVDVEQGVKLIKEAASVLNSTLVAVESCISGVTGSQSSTGHDFGTCITFAYAALMPEVQDVIKKYQEVVPNIQNQIDAIEECLDATGTNPTTPGS